MAEVGRNEVGAAHLESDPDRLRALLWLLRAQRRGPAHSYTPPLTRREHAEKPKPFAVLELRGRRRKKGATPLLDHAHLVADHGTWTGPVEPAMLSYWLIEHIFTKALRGHLVVVPGGVSGVFASLIEQCAPDLIRLGFTIEPIARNSEVAWLVIRRHKHKWTLTDPTVMTGLSLTRLLSLAPRGARWGRGGYTFAYRLRAAVRSFATFVGENFGCSLRPSVSMVGMSAARGYLPEWAALWRTPPLLETFERAGGGYRGGWQWGRRFRGTSWRMDINRAFTYWLGAELPYRARLVKWREHYASRGGVFLCTVRKSGRWSFPLAVWSGDNRGFVVRNVFSTPAVCVVHLCEVEALRAAGYELELGVGFIWRDTFSLTEYVDKLQSTTDAAGRNTARGEICKWLGNTVYGKFGQRTEVSQLKYAEKRPDTSWRPFLTLDGRDLDGLWSRSITRRTIYHHVEVAAEVSALCRAHMLDMVEGLRERGVQTVRVHTDSLTCTADPTLFLTTSESEFGMPRVEYAEQPSLIYQHSGYTVLGSTHLSGASAVSESEMGELVDGIPVNLLVDMKSPPWGSWPQGGRIMRTFGLVAVNPPAERLVNVDRGYKRDSATEQEHHQEPDYGKWQQDRVRCAHRTPQLSNAP